MNCAGSSLQPKRLIPPPQLLEVRAAEMGGTGFPGRRIGVFEAELRGSHSSFGIGLASRQLRQVPDCRAKAAILEVSASSGVSMHGTTLQIRHLEVTSM